VLIGTGFAYYQSQLTIISQQVSKGFEQLGSDKIVVRLGGIYALEGVMNTSEQYHQTVLEGLCAFVRDGTKTDTGQRPPATDIQAALTVIGRRAAGTGVVDLNGSHVSKAKLSLANLREADLRGADLSGADLSFAALFLADLRGADLSGADLSFAHLEITNVTQSQLDKACSDRGTHLPSGLTIKPCKAIHP
jgi:Pentapeptide repeats (8 copies)